MIRSVAVVIALCALLPSAWSQDSPEFRVREGYAVTYASEPLEEARFMEFGEEGTLYVSCPRAGKILTLRDTNGDGVYEPIAEFVSGYPQAHGMHYYGGWLWFTQSLAIHKGRDTTGDGVADEIVTILPEGSLPGGRGHWWRPIFVTDQGFYTSVGDSGNITEDLDNDRQKLWFYSLDGQERELFASGIRNTEKYRFRPGTDELWGVDHASDWYGEPLGENRDLQPITDYIPHEEVNHYVKGEFYGHPYFGSDRIPRLEYLDRPDLLELASKTRVPEWNLRAHTAPNGFIFVEEDNHFPADHVGDMFIACHGSWNSSTRVGYSIERVLFDDQTGKPFGQLRIVSCLTSDDVAAGDESGVLARPVDCVIEPDGAMLFSCDYTNRLYRITYVGR